MSQTLPPPAPDRSRGKQWMISGVAGMASYMDAAAIVSTGSALVMFQEPLGLTTGDLGRLSALLTIMIAVGALTGGRLGDRFGRRSVFTLTMVVATAGAVLCGVATGPAVLYLGIVLLGLGTGADLPVSLAMIAEEADEEHRGQMVSFSHVLWLVGIIAVGVIGTVVGSMGATGARIMYAHLVLVGAAVLALRFGLPESEQWRRAHAAETAAPAGQGMGALKALLRPPYLASMVLLALFYALVNIAANTGGQFSSFMYVDLAHSTVNVASAVSVVGNLVCIAATAAFMRVVDGPYRKVCYAVGAVVLVVAYVVPLTAGVHVATLATMNVLASIGGVFAGEPMYKVWSQELFPTLLRSTAQGTCIAFTRLVAAAVALVTPSILAASTSLLYGFIVVALVVGTGLGYLAIMHRPVVADDAQAAPATV